MNRILVVDDEPDLEALLMQQYRRQVREGRYSFVFAGDGVEAMARLAEDRHLDMVLCDINMPRMDGLTLLDHIKRTDHRLATVMVSANGDMEKIRTAMNRGAFDFLTKPIDFADLDATIERTLHHVSDQRLGRARQAEAERAHAALSRFFPPNLAGHLASDPAALSSRRREIATVFTDITGFTALVETLAPEVLGPLLNEYLGEMTDIVFAHEGTLAKIVGDALHVLFGAPTSQPDHAARAVACAMALDAHSETLRTRWRERGVDLGVTRIGVDAGPAVVGRFGGANYFDYTAYGDTVNTAARLQAANKAFGTRVCVSETAAGLIAGFNGRPMGDLMLRGRSEPLRAYEALPEGVASGPYRAAFDKLAAGDAGAMAAFAALVSAEGGDPMAQYHLRRLLNGEMGVRVLVGD